jgi:hypothetical protein
MSASPNPPIDTPVPIEKITSLEHRVAKLEARLGRRSHRSSRRSEAEVAAALARLVAECEVEDPRTPEQLKARAAFDDARHRVEISSRARPPAGRIDAFREWLRGDMELRAEANELQQRLIAANAVR